MRPIVFELCVMKKKERKNKRRKERKKKKKKKEKKKDKTNILQTIFATLRNASGSLGALSTLE